MKIILASLQYIDLHYNISESLLMINEFYKSAKHSN